MLLVSVGVKALCNKHVGEIVTYTQFHQHFTSSFNFVLISFSQRIAKPNCKQIKVVKKLFSSRSARKMSVKSITSVNVNKILRAAFCTYMFCKALIWLQLGFVNF